MKKIARASILLLFIILLGSCRDELPLDTFEYENYLVVEATLTNELKQQEVRLSRTTQLDTSFTNYENNAEVYVMVNEAQRYDFDQTDEGIYRSNDIFNTISGNNYMLFINTQNGRTYASNLVSPSAKPIIEDFYAERIVNKDSIEGIQVYMDIQGQNNNASFSFSYEETYKIQSPYPSPIDYEILNYMIGPGEGVSYDLITKSNPRLDEETFCYTTDISTGINLGNSGSLDINKLERQPVLFIPSNSPKLRERYSILGKVYSQNLSSSIFYQNLAELGNNNGLLSQKQPGFISGNISSLNDNRENVLGFFDVALESQQRIFFDFSDFNFQKPNSFFECSLTTLNYDDNTVTDRTLNQRVEIYNLLNSGAYRIYSKDSNFYTIVRDFCSDCNTYSSNIKPVFWED